MIFPKKSLGQNFLIDKNIINKILDLLNIEDQNIIEIGPGTGSLTNEILKRNPKSLLLIEKDNKLFDKLRSNYSKNKMVKIINADILKFNIEKLCDDKTSIVGNLPYNISSQILVKIIKFNKWPPKFKNLTLMFQKELGDKIIGKHSTKDYGRISILTSYRFNVEKKFIVSPNSFFPKPKIKSIVLQFKPKKLKEFKIKRIESLEKVTNIFFSNKRKMIKKNVKKILSAHQIKFLKDLKLDLRPSEIKPSTYYRITELYESK